MSSFYDPEIYLSSDRAGFPLVYFHPEALEVSLWPVMKMQWERFLCETQRFGDAWYEQILTVNERVSWQHFTSEEREQLVITGIQPQEARLFTKWLGKDFDLPTAQEWRAVDQRMKTTPMNGDTLTRLRQGDLSPSAHTILERLLRYINPQTWGELMLLRGGVLEWVHSGSAFGLLGKPRPHVLPSGFNPQQGPVISLTSAAQNQRLPYIGFRVVRRMNEKERIL